MMPPLDRRVWRRSPDVAHVTSADRAALLDLSNVALAPYLLHGPGAVMWRQLSVVSSTAEVRRAVARHFELSETDVAESVTGFLQELAALGLVEVEP